MGGIGVAHRQDFPEPVVRNRHRHRGTAGRSILDAPERDVGVTARNRLVERGRGNQHELRPPAQPPGDEAGNLDVETHQSRRVGRISFDERRSTFGISRPPEHVRLLGRGRRVDGR